ncbi:MAG: hypothetical protein ACRC37_03530 [Lentisphaeria bacterium]
MTENGEIAETYDYSPFGRRSLISYQFSDSETLSENLNNLEDFANPFQF